MLLGGCAVSALQRPKSPPRDLSAPPSLASVRLSRSLTRLAPSSIRHVAPPLSTALHSPWLVALPRILRGSRVFLGAAMTFRQRLLVRLGLPIAIALTVGLSSIL